MLFIHSCDVAAVIVTPSKWKYLLREGYSIDDMTENSAGMFICGFSEGGISGPLGEEATNIFVEFGEPVLNEFDPFDTVRPVEKAFEFLRYSDPRLQENIYVVRFEPSRIIWGMMDESAIGIPATPALHKVFDVYLPEWLREMERYQKEKIAAYKTGVRGAGLEWSKGKELLEKDRKDGAGRYYNEFYLTAVRHIEQLPKPVLVRLEGLDEIVQAIPITTPIER